MDGLLEREIDLLVARLRHFTPARYAAPAPPFGTRADAAWHLAGQLVAAAGVDRPLPPLPVMALADVIAVTGNELLLSAPEPPIVAAVLAEVLLHRYELDGSLPGPRAAAAVLPLLDPAVPADREQLLPAARRRCPAYR